MGGGLMAMICAALCVPSVAFNCIASASTDCSELRFDQSLSVFRIDISAATLNDTLIWLIIGLMDSERRGRIARATLPSTIEELFMCGAKAETAQSL